MPILSLLVFFFNLLLVPPIGQTQQKLESMGTQNMPSLDSIEQDKTEKDGKRIWGTNKV